MLAGLTAATLFQQADTSFEGSIRSFRRLTPAEAEAIKPDRIDLHVVRQGDTWASLAQRSGGAIKPTTLAILNHAAPTSQPVPGQRIKIVTGG
jgi:predicted Zn-dependent protease